MFSRHSLRGLLHFEVRMQAGRYMPSPETPKHHIESENRGENEKVFVCRLAMHFSTCEIHNQRERLCVYAETRRETWGHSHKFCKREEVDKSGGNP